MFGVSKKTLFLTFRSHQSGRAPGGEGKLSKTDLPHFKVGPGPSIVAGRKVQAKNVFFQNGHQINLAEIMTRSLSDRSMLSYIQHETSTTTHIEHTVRWVARA